MFITTNMDVVYPITEVSVTLSITSPCFQPLSVSMGQKVASTTPFCRASYVSGWLIASGVPPRLWTILEDNPVARTFKLAMSSSLYTGFREARMPGPWACTYSTCTSETSWG